MEDGERWRRARLRQVKYVNNIVEGDHHRAKRLVRSRLCTGSHLDIKMEIELW
jgi:transposase, IS6 family